MAKVYITGSQLQIVNMIYHNSYMHCANITCDLYQISKVCNLIIYARSNAEIYHRNAKEHVTNIKYKVKAIAIRGLDRL